MKRSNILVHIGLIVLMFAVACVYMAPALSGKVIMQGDIQKSDAMAYEQLAVQKQTGDIPNWAASMFSGMPGYQVAVSPQHSAFQPVRNALILRPLGLDRNIGVLFLYLLGFYVAMLAFGATPWLALVGALAFGLGSYNLIIIEAGHITKGWAMSMIAPVLAGMYLTLRTAFADDDSAPQKRKRRMLWGVLLFTLALILQISFNHIQITFYTAIACVIMGIAYLIYALYKHCAKAIGVRFAVLILGAAIAFGCNVRLLLVNEEYSRYTMRGGNELTVTPDDLYGETTPTATENTSNGLNIDYAFNWSYGRGETYTLLVPGALGGGSTEKVGRDSDFYRAFRTDRAPLYWGEQPFTSGPSYFGAIIILLFVAGMFITKGPERWWLLASSLLAIMLSWGHNFMPFNEWIFNNVPLYNKFRTPSMALVLANVCMVIMAVLTLKSIFAKDSDQKRINRGLYISTALTAGIILVGLIISGTFDYSGASDRQMQAQYGKQWDSIANILVAERQHLFRADSWRSLALVVIAALVLWLYNNKKLVKKQSIPIVALALLITIDLWGVDVRYLNKENFVNKRKVELRRDQYDYEIDRMAEAFNDSNYRVLNLAVNTFNDSKPSAFHHQIGGYSAAKLSRYQNIIDFYISRHMNMSVLNMLNTRYVVVGSQQGPMVQRNPDALGNAWFVNQIKAVGNPNEEILALNDFDPRTTAVVDTSVFHGLPTQFTPDTTATIVLIEEHPYTPDRLTYTTSSLTDQLAVFSEIHYAPDWFAYIDGKPANYIRANYVLRAMNIPAGEHTITFVNEAPRLHRLDLITLIISLATLIGMVVAIIMVYRKPRTE
ncbi:MAG: hypothetical protein IJ761_06765 [Bacteroidales bacterium]|nr:hypothetical protein [Bacteroidales bacterium]